MTRKIRKAVFPVAGMGTRFLPATKANPKEMLPIVDKPLIQYAVEEAIEAGVEELVFVTSSSKRAIEDHFDKNFELETLLERRGKFEMLEQVRHIVPRGVDCVYVRQAEALGLGHAVLCAAPVVGDEPFAVILADDLVRHPKGCLRQMVEVYEATGASVLGVEDVPPNETDKYGIIAGEELDDRLTRVSAVVEKPRPSQAPSNRAIVGRYLLSGRIFELLRRTPRGTGGEFQLTDAIADLLALEPVMGYRFDGKRYDCGSKLGYLLATTELALEHPELGREFIAYLQQLVRDDPRLREAAVSGESAG